MRHVYCVIWCMCPSVVFNHWRVSMLFTVAQAPVWDICKHHDDVGWWDSLDNNQLYCLLFIKIFGIKCKNSTRTSNVCVLCSFKLDKMTANYFCSLFYILQFNAALRTCWLLCITRIISLAWIALIIITWNHSMLINYWYSVLFFTATKSEFGFTGSL